MPDSCCVTGCHNFAWKTKGTGIQYFPFPKVLQKKFGLAQFQWTKSHRELWIKKINRVEKDGKPWRPSGCSRVCSVHFISGQPSQHPNDPDYAPTVKMVAKNTNGPSQIPNNPDFVLTLHMGPKNTTTSDGSKSMLENHQLSGTEPRKDVMILCYQPAKSVNNQDFAPTLNMGPNSTSDGSTPNSTSDGSNPNSTSDGRNPNSTSDGRNPNRTSDGSNLTQTSDGSNPKHTSDVSNPHYTSDGSNLDYASDGSNSLPENHQMSVEHEKPCIEPNADLEIHLRSSIDFHDYNATSITPMVQFCEVCGSLRLRDVAEQLQKLFTEKSIQPNVCVICKETIPELGQISERTGIAKGSAKTQGDFTNSEISRTCVNSMQPDDNLNPDVSDDNTHGDTNHKNATKCLSANFDPGDICDPEEIDDPEDIDDPENMDDPEDTDYPGNTSETDETGLTAEPDAQNETPETASNPPTIRPKCKYDFKVIDPELLKLTASSKNPKRPFQCKFCDHGPFRYLNSFQNHIRLHGRAPIRKPYTCDVCGACFKTMYIMMCHKSIHSNDKNCPYTDCKFRFKFERNLKTHLQTHSGMLQYRCEKCGVGFAQEHRLLTHQTTHMKTFSCQYCDKLFSLQKRLTEHIRTHEKVDRFRCVTVGCKFTCKTTSELQQHTIAKHRRKRAYMCAMCERVFKSKNLLYRHGKRCKCKPTRPVTTVHKSTLEACVITADINIKKSDITTKWLDRRVVRMMAKPESLEMPFKCKYCKSKDFKSPLMLVRHMRDAHPRKKNTCMVTHPYRCDKCGKGFKRPHGMMTHLPCDFGGGPFLCNHNGCDKKFDSKKRLKRHKNIHIGKQLMCSVCGKRYTSLRQLREHDLVVHQGVKSYKCDQCHLDFFYRYDLRKHVRLTHSDKALPTWVCEICGKTLTTQNGLQSHALRHTAVKAFACQHCSYRCWDKHSLKSHSKIHTGRYTLHRCIECGVDLYSQHALRRHMTIDHPSPPVPDIPMMPFQGPPRFLATNSTSVSGTGGEPTSVTTGIILMEFPHHFVEYSS